MVKHVKIESKLLTAFWGHPFYIGATVLLPKGYDEHPNERYATIYSQGHFGLGNPLGFADPENPGRAGRVGAGGAGGRGGRANIYDAWNSDGFPRMIAVTFQHPTPYFDDSYAVNSASNGPYDTKDKLHVYVGDMDNYYLNLAAYLLEDFLNPTNSGATFEYGRPKQGHGWQPMSNAELVGMMAAQIQKNAK